MDTENLSKKMKNFFTNGAKASKEAFVKAGDKVQEFSDKSLIKIEKKQLENKLNTKYSELGQKIYVLADKNIISFTNEDDKKSFDEMFNQIKDFQKLIQEKEDLLSKNDK